MYHRIKHTSELAWFFLFGFLSLNASQVFAENKVFTAVVEETVTIERVYEVHEISFNILTAEEKDSFLVGGSIRGEAGLDAITGRVIVNIDELNKAGMSMQAVGYVESEDKQKGIPACTLWQTRMFEESKLCYAAEVAAGQSYKIVLSVEDNNFGEVPVASGQ